MTNNNPFGNFDYATMLKQMQESPMMKMWQDSDLYKSMMGADGKIDYEGLWETQKKNLAALNDMNVKLGTQMTDVAKEQASMMGKAWETMQDYSKRAMEGGDVDASKTMKQGEEVFQKAMENMQELGKRGMEMSEGMAETMQKRMNESIAELQDLIKKYSA